MIINNFYGVITVTSTPLAYRSNGATAMLDTFDKGRTFTTYVDLLKSFTDKGYNAVKLTVQTNSLKIDKKPDITIFMEINPKSFGQTYKGEPVLYIDAINHNVVCSQNGKTIPGVTLADFLTGSKAIRIGQFRKECNGRAA